MALDISKAFGRAWHSDLLHKLTSFGVSGQIFGLTFSFLNNRRLQVVLNGKSSQENPVNAGVPEGSILGPTLFLQLAPLPFSRGRSTCYFDRLHDFSVTIPRCYKDVYVNSFFPRT